MKLTLTLLIVIFQCSAITQVHHTDWTINLSDDSKLSDATLLSLTNDTLNVISLGQTQHLAISSISKIQRRESSAKTGMGIILGGALGVGVGYLIGSITEGSSTSSALV